MQLQLLLDDDPILRRLQARLLAAHGPQRDAERLDPMSQFVGALISPQTSDEVSGAALLRLAARFPRWEELPDAAPTAILELLGDMKFASDKALHLIEAARLIRERSGGLDLGFLADWPIERAMAWLESLPGSGPKVAAATLNFSHLRKRVIALDLHALRVLFRIGLLPDPRNAARGLRIIMRLLPDGFDADDLYELHWLIRRHSQSTCHARNPQCGTCPLADLCAQRQTETSAGAEETGSRITAEQIPHPETVAIADGKPDVATTEEPVSPSSGATPPEAAPAELVPEKPVQEKLVLEKPAAEKPVGERPVLVMRGFEDTSDFEQVPLSEAEPDELPPEDLPPILARPEKAMRSTTSAFDQARRRRLAPRALYRRAAR